MPNFNIKYEDSEDLKADCVNKSFLTCIKSNVGRYSCTIAHIVEKEKIRHTFDDVVEPHFIDYLSKFYA